MSKLFIGVIIGILLFGGVSAYLIVKNNPVPGTSLANAANSQDNLANANSGEVQKVTLSLRNGNYYPSVLTVKRGIPVELTLDNSVAGCYRSFNIPAFGVSSYSSNPSQVITFTPTTAGSFPFACSMGMGRGTLNVE